MKKLSELTDDTILVLGRNSDYDDICVTKGEFVEGIKGYLEDLESLHIGIPDIQKFDWADVFDRHEEDSFEDFAEYVEREISEEDWKVLKRAAEIVNAAFAANPNFETGEIVDLDMKIENDSEVI
jgi:hypothetical protein